MLEHFVDFFVTQPKRLVAVGTAIYSASSILIVLGAYANLYLGALNEFNRLNHQATSPQTLAVIFPESSTWWIPESIIGFVLAFILAAVGAIIAREGKTLEKLITY